MMAARRWSNPVHKPEREPNRNRGCNLGTLRVIPSLSGAVARRAAGVVGLAVVLALLPVARATAASPSGLQPSSSAATCSGSDARQLVESILRLRIAGDSALRASVKGQFCGPMALSEVSG